MCYTVKRVHCVLKFIQIYLYQRFNKSFTTISQYITTLKNIIYLFSIYIVFLVVFLNFFDGLRIFKI